MKPTGREDFKRILKEKGEAQMGNSDDYKYGGKVGTAEKYSQEILAPMNTANVRSYQVPEQINTIGEQIGMLETRLVELYARLDPALKVESEACESTPDPPYESLVGMASVLRDLSCRLVVLNAEAQSVLYRLEI